MTPEEKRKHLEALEDMFERATAEFGKQFEDLIPHKWRTAIDAFEAQTVELANLRAAADNALAVASRDDHDIAAELKAWQELRVTLKAPK